MKLNSHPGIPQSCSEPKEMEDALGFKPEAAWQTRDLII